MKKRFRLNLTLLSILMMLMLLLTIPKTYAYTYLGGDNGHWSNDDFTDYVNIEGVTGFIDCYDPEYDEVGVICTIDDAVTYAFSLNDFENELQSAITNGFFIDIPIKWNVSIQKWENNSPVVDSKPVYSGETAFVTNVDNPITLESVLSKIKAIDNEDGDITHKIVVVSDNYSANKNKIGTYAIKLSVTDTAGNTATLDVSILVKDVTVPVITGPKTYSQSYTTKKDVGSILSTLSATDNYDSVAPVVKVKTDNYSANYNRIGTYTIIFYATDTSGNEGTYTVTVNVIDTVAPVFTGPKTILKGQTETLTIETIKSQITANDFIDGATNFIVETDNYTGFGHKVGTYTIIFKATDKSNNSSTHTLTITVKDNIPPVFYVDNYFITVEQSVNLTRQDIIDLLVASGQLIIQSSTKIDFLQNEYEGNETTPGVYAVSLRSSSTDGSSNVYSVAVLVEEVDDGIVLEPELTFFQKIGKFFGSIWSWVKAPTTENGNFYKGYYVLIGFGAIGVLYFVKKIIGKKRRW